MADPIGQGGWIWIKHSSEIATVWLLLMLLLLIFEIAIVGFVLHNVPLSLASCRVIK